MENFNEGCPLKLSNNYEYDKNELSNRKSKQVKRRWSEEEQVKFLEGLELYGAKSKLYWCLDIKKIVEHIGTRSVAQVRSHLQKHQLKEKKGKSSVSSN